MKNISKLQVITQHLLHRSEEEQAEEALRGGADWIQLRIKGERQAQWRESALRVKEVTDRYGASLIINDNPQLALEIGASGVHLGGEDSSIKDARKLLGSDIIIGGTANSFADIVSLTDAGVDYIGLGPFRFTTTKDNLSPIIGLEGYQTIAKQMRLEGITTPVVAIGGITIADIRDILDQGVYGIAVSGEVVNAVSPLEQSRNFLKEINR